MIKVAILRFSDFTLKESIRRKHLVKVEKWIKINHNGNSHRNWRLKWVRFFTDFY